MKMKKALHSFSLSWSYPHDKGEWHVIDTLDDKIEMEFVPKYDTHFCQHKISRFIVEIKRIKFVKSLPSIPFGIRIWPLK